MVRCGLGASRFASVGTDGTLYSCQEMCDNDDEGSIFKMGHILNGVSDSKRRAIFQPFKVKEVVSDKPELCNDCPMFRICDGACTVNNYFVNKDLNVMPSILCQYYIWLYEEAKRISKIAKEMGINPSLLKKKGIE